MSEERLDWSPLSKEEVSILTKVYELTVELNSKVFELQEKSTLGNLYFLALDNLLGAVRGLTDPEEMKRNPLYIKEKIVGAKKYLENILRSKVEAEVPTILPEGVATVAFGMETEKYAEMVETIFEGVMSGKYEFRSAVNFDSHVRTVMYEKETRGRTPIEVVCKDKDTAWSLQQTIDWTLKREINVVAIRRQKNMVEVAYLRKGIPALPPKEKLVYTFKKTDGWSLVGEPKK